jgi:short-subunit dehydrogenase
MNKVALVTGASAGIGKETAILLAKNNYTVYAAARRLDKMKDLEALGISIFSMDVTDETSMLKGVQQILDSEKKIDVLVNNAGFGAYGTIEDMQINDAKYQLEVNVFGAARLIQLVLPKMRANKSGKIVNISSIGGKFATPFGGWYHASKFALEALSDSLRNEVKPFGIDVIVIEPGGIKSEWADIAIDNLLKNSAKSAYKAAIDRFADFLKKSTENNSEPLVIARLILHSIEAKKPKLRYAGGYNARLAVIARKLLSDNMFDKIIVGQMK